MKNEPFTKKGKRLHLHCGESLCSHRGMWLKAGTTALVLSVIDAGKRPGEAVQLDSPLAAMKKFTVDPTCTARAPLTNGDAWTAIEIQRHYLRSVQEQLGVLSLPSWAEEVCIEWGRILDLLGGAPDSVATTLDWGIKYALYKNHARSAGIEMRTFPLWTYVCSRLVGAVPADGKPYTVKMGIEGDLRAEPEKVRLSRLLDNKGFSWDQALMFLKLQKNLYEIDIKFSQLGPSGIFSQLDAGGVLDHRVPGVERIEEAIAEPPESSRAFIRGKEIQRLASQMASEENPDKSPSLGLLVDWDRIVDAKKGRALNLDDPFESEVHWQNIMMSDRRRAALAGPEELRPLDESPF